MLQKTPHGLDNTPNFDDEFDAIDLTVGFGRGKSPSKKQIANQPRRIGTRSTTKSGKRKTAGKELLLSPSKIKKETEPVEVFEDAASEVVTTDHNYTNDYNSVSNPQDIILQDNTGNLDCLAESEKSVPSKDDDLSSLEVHKYFIFTFKVIHSSFKFTYFVKLCLTLCNLGSRLGGPRLQF